MLSRSSIIIITNKRHQFDTLANSMYIETFKHFFTFFLNRDNHTMESVIKRIVVMNLITVIKATLINGFLLLRVDAM